MLLDVSKDWKWGDKAEPRGIFGSHCSTNKLYSGIGISNGKTGWVAGRVAVQGSWLDGTWGHDLAFAETERCAEGSLGLHACGGFPGTWHIWVSLRHCSSHEVELWVWEDWENCLLRDTA